MVLVLNPNTFSLPSLPANRERRESGIAAPKDVDKLSVPEPARVLTPNKPQVLAPEEEDIAKFTPSRNKENGQPSPSEVAHALGSFDTYFDKQLHQEFPSHYEPNISRPSQAVQRVKIEKQAFDKATGSRGTIEVTKPGYIEEECLTGIAIAARPGFTGTRVAQNAIKATNAVLEDARSTYLGDGSEYVPLVPEMPDLLRNARECVEVTQSKRRREGIYDVINQVSIPAPQVSELGFQMDKLGDLKHPLAYRLLITEVPESPWHREQADRREKLLSLLSADPQTLFNNFQELQKLARGLVCSVNPINPPTGKIGIEIEYGQGGEEIELPRFDIGSDGDNLEIKRSFRNIDFNQEYLRDLSILGRYLQEKASHISSFHLHLDRNDFPEVPGLGNLLGNLDGLEIEENDVGTWEVRGLVAPSLGNKLDPACIADIIQLYTAAGTPLKLKEHPLLSVSDDSKLSVDQIIFGHICMNLDYPEGRLAALKALEHPLALKAVDPQSLIDNFNREYVESVFNLLSRDLMGRYAHKRLVGAAKIYGFSTKHFEALGRKEMEAEYISQVEILEEVGILKKLLNGESGIIGEDGKEYPVPTMSQIMDKFEEQSKVLEQKMRQGFQRLLLVPFGMSIHDLGDIYSERLKFYNEKGMLSRSNKGNPDPIDKTSTNLFSRSWRCRNLSYTQRSIGDIRNAVARKKSEVIADSAFAGWVVALVEDNPSLPQKGEGEFVMERSQFEDTSAKYRDLVSLRSKHV